MHYHWRGLVSRSCSGWEGVVPRRYGRQTVTCTVRRVVRAKRQRGRSVWWFCCCVIAFSRVSLVLQGYRIKPHGQLVSVSLTHYCASTPDLSTSWSSTTLQGARGPGISYLEASFTLRCFQRLSLPHLATRRCDWRHNRSTRGTSTPVLSY